MFIVEPPIATGRRWWRFWGLAALGLGFLGYARLTYGRDLPIMCPYRRLTGHRCPLCGVTTATGHLLQGEARQMLRANPLAPGYLLAALAWFGLEARALITTHSKITERI